MQFQDLPKDIQKRVLAAIDWNNTSICSSFINESFRENKLNLSHFKGSIQRLYPQQNETLEEQCKRELRMPLNSYYDSYTEMILADDNYTILNGELYLIVWGEYIEPNYVFYEMEKIDSDSYNYEIRFDSHKMTFEQALEEAMRNMNRNEN